MVGESDKAEGEMHTLVIPYAASFLSGTRSMIEAPEDMNTNFPPGGMSEMVDWKSSSEPSTCQDQPGMSFPAVNLVDKKNGNKDQKISH